MPKAPFPLVWDSTMLSAGRSCPQRLRMMYLEHWKPAAESVHLVAGAAFASGLEAARRAFFVDGRLEADAIGLGLDALFRKYGPFEAPDDSAKNVVRVAGALEYYFSEYPLGRDGATPHLFGGARPGIEFSFAEPLPVTHPVTGEPLIFAGRADMVADAMGGLFVYDEKTTSQLGDSWLKQWDLRSQFTAYCWGLRGHGIHPTGVMVRGVSILKTKYETKQVPTYRADWEVERWLRQTIRDLERFKGLWLADEWDYSLDHACTEYGGCAFAARVCKSPEPERWLPMYFHRRAWDPLARQETPILEPA